MLIAAVLLLFTLLCITLSDDRAWDNVTRTARNQLIFDGRHQAYGAFQLRRDYDRRFAFAILLGIGTLGAGVSVARLLAPEMAISLPRSEHGVDIVLPQVIDPPVTPDPPAPRVTPPSPPTPPKPPAPGAGTIIVIDSTRTLDPGPPSLAGPTSGPAGPVGPDPGLVPPGPPGGGGDPGGSPFVPTGVVNMTDVQELPEFPGGEASMYHWLPRNVDLGGIDFDREQVYVQFVVGEDGTVRDVKCVKGSNKLLMRAAEDAVRRMPKWKAARMNGHDVACRLVLPISFETH